MGEMGRGSGEYIAAIKVQNGADWGVRGLSAIALIFRGSRGQPIEIPRAPFSGLIAGKDPPNLG